MGWVRSKEAEVRAFRSFLDGRSDLRLGRRGAESPDAGQSLRISFVLLRDSMSSDTRDQLQDLDDGVTHADSPQ